MLLLIHSQTDRLKQYNKLEKTFDIDGEKSSRFLRKEFSFLSRKESLDINIKEGEKM